MADIKQIQVGNTTYDIKDATARAALETKQNTIDEVSVDYTEDGGSPDASASFDGGELNFNLKNMKMKFSELTAEEKEELRGPKGDQGDSVLVGHGDLPLAHVPGEDNTKAISQQGVTDAFPQMDESEEATIDLDIVDKWGSSIARIASGNIKTKNFDSSKVQVETGTAASSELSLQDSNANVSLKVSDGHIKTKKFNSKSAVYERQILPLSVVEGYINDDGTVTESSGYNEVYTFNIEDYRNVTLVVDGIRKPGSTTSTRVAVAYYNGDTFLCGELQGSGDAENIYGYELAAPAAATKVKIQTNTNSSYIPAGATLTAVYGTKNAIFTKPMSLTAEEKAKARENIGAASMEDAGALTSGYADAAEYNVYRKAMQLGTVKWTPKVSFYGRNLQHVAGVEQTGIPYSSVMECRKYVGLDVSLHTFMTAINDAHSLQYTEVTGIANGATPSSAYGFEYHGPASCSCYFATVCSGYTSAVLGLAEQFNTWEHKSKYFFEYFNKLDIQDIQNLKIGDVLWQEGHVLILSAITRDHGVITSVVVTDHWVPIRYRTMTVAELYNIVKEIGGVWCRCKMLYKNVEYKPSTFNLLNGEKLYNVGDFVYVDGASSRTFYRCSTANSDSAFDSSKWSAVPIYSSGSVYNANTYVSSGENLYYVTSKITSASSISNSNTERVKGVFEWADYPYVYNDDICTYAGDRASFHMSDTIYINYDKGDYTSMQLYKDGTLIQTITLPDDSTYQINVSSYCASAGMYKARLTDGTNYSRYTYFEVIDTTASVSISDGVVTVSFSSSNAVPLEICMRALNGFPLWHHVLNEDEIEEGAVKINVAGMYLAQKPDGSSINAEHFCTVAFKGEYGTAISPKASVGTITSIGGLLVYPDEMEDFTLTASKNIVLAGRMKGRTYTFNVGTSSNNIAATIIPACGEIKWASELPSTLVSGKTYLVTVTNGIGNVITI